MATLNRADLEFLLRQILIAEAHAAGTPLRNLVSDATLPYGIRTVSGIYNNLIPGQETFGAADTIFPRLTDPVYRPAYEPTSGLVVDSQPRTISNLIVDATAGNDAATQAALAAGGQLVTSPGLDGEFGTADDKQVWFIPNQTPDVGLSAPFNSWMTLFGQFFDHGLDLVPKGGSGTVFIPLQPDDPLFVPGSPTNFMVLTRATNQPGPDGVVGTADDIREQINLTTSFVDQNQTYTSSASHQVFLREYAPDNAGQAVATGRLLNGPGNNGLPTWADVKAQAATMLGITLTDSDVHNVPLLATDEYGRFIRGPNGFAQVVVRTGNGADGVAGTADDVHTLVEGVPGGLDLNNIPGGGAVVRTGHAFLDDIAHAANPRAGQVADADGVVGHDGTPNSYDDELLDAHYITGDGRGNENIGLTSVHHIFHSEHNRQIDEIKATIVATGDAAFIAQWLTPGANQSDGVQAGEWNGERLFQSARFATEMQYQHLVFEEFARRVQPEVNVFAGIATDIDPAIVAEFAHTVYRFGHSMLTETVARTNADGTANDIDLISAFLNPLEFATGGTGAPVTAEQAAGAIVRGMTNQVGNEIDEFVTEALRNNLVGLPLDLATINIARGRDTGIPSLNEARRQFFDATNHPALEPYTSWADFSLNLRHPASLVNFVAAYGQHASITAATTLDDKRAAAILLVFGDGGESEPADRLDFMNSTGAWATAESGLNLVDFWVGGLAERQAPFGGLLGSTFNFVFETQMERLQDGDRFYYLHRTAGMNFLQELEENSFAELVMRNTTGVNHLPHDVFSTPAMTIEASVVNAAVANSQPLPYPDTIVQPNGAIRYLGDQHIVMGGTEGNDHMIASEGDDAMWGDGGNDRLEGGSGNDAIIGGAGDDILTDVFGIDVIKGGEGNDVISAGSGTGDLILSGAGSDFVIAGDDEKETFAAEGNDFVSAGNGISTVFGGEGDDWIEGGDQADLLQGDNGDPFQNSPIAGNDVIRGDSGNDDYDAESGDDIMFAGVGTERFEGMLGFDWVTYVGSPGNADADMRFTGLLPPDVDAIRDRFDLVEGLSGGTGTDILRGNDANTATMTTVDANSGFNDSINNVAQINLIGGLQDLLGAGVTSFTGGNIILGGDGSDMIEGRGGNDLIDGDRWLTAQIEWTDGAGTHRADSMAQLQSQMLAGTLNPGSLRIVREIRSDRDNIADIDTAVFSGNLADYAISAADSQGRRTVTDNRVGGADGTDTLIGIERIQFADQAILFGVNNLPPQGVPTISDTTPTEDQALTASAAGVTDPDNPNGGVITGPISFQWQQEEEPGVWVNVDDQVANLASFTPGDGQVGLALRVRMSYVDASGVPEITFSAGTAPVVNVNDAPVGTVNISDTTPTEGQALSAVNTFTDADGLGAVLAYQWASSADGGLTWAAIAGATAATFTPTQAQVAQQLRVSVSYTDGNGTLETLTSAATGGVGDLITGTNVAETLAGTAFDDHILGLGGADTLNGNDGADLLEGGAGGDTLNGDNGNDNLLGEAGNDTLNGGDGADTLDGGADNDTLNGGAGADNMSGGLGNDSFVVDNAGDVVIELSAAGTDTVQTTLAAYSLNAQNNVENLDFIGAGGFTGIGNALANTISGGAGNDVLDGGAGADTLNGGGGNDTLMVDNAADVAVGGGGVDTVLSTSATYVLTNATTENLTFTSLGSFTGTGNGDGNVITGGAQGDNLSGLGGADTLRGLSGADTLDGGVGADTLDGGIGADTMTGGDGGDTYIVDDALDVVNETGAAGTDVVRTSLNTYALTGGVENLVFTGSGNFSATGNALANNITGGAGDDSYFIGTGDTVTEAAGGGTDTVFTNAANHTLSANVENLVFTGVGNFAGSGNGDANSLTGGAGNDTLNGGGGNDRIEGGAGNDTMNGGAGQNVFVFGAGFGADTILSFDANATGGQDLLDISALGITAATFAASVLITTGQFTGGPTVDTRVTIGANTIVLDGVTGANANNAITVADFILAAPAVASLASFESKPLQTVKSDGAVDSFMFEGARADGQSTQMLLTAELGMDLLVQMAHSGMRMAGMPMLEAASVAELAALVMRSEPVALHQSTVAASQGDWSDAWQSMGLDTPLSFNTQPAFESEYLMA